MGKFAKEDPKLFNVYCSQEQPGLLPVLGKGYGQRRRPNQEQIDTDTHKSVVEYRIIVDESSIQCKCADTRSLPLLCDHRSPSTKVSQQNREILR